MGFRIATWFWNSRDLSSYADSGDFRTITKRINGGYNGEADRNQYYATRAGRPGLTLRRPDPRAERGGSGLPGGPPSTQ